MMEPGTLVRFTPEATAKLDPDFACCVLMIEAIIGDETTVVRVGAREGSTWPAGDLRAAMPPLPGDWLQCGQNAGACIQVVGTKAEISYPHGNRWEDLQDCVPIENQVSLTCELAWHFSDGRERDVVGMHYSRRRVMARAMLDRMGVALNMTPAQLCAEAAAVSAMEFDAALAGLTELRRRVTEPAIAVPERAGLVVA